MPSQKTRYSYIFLLLPVCPMTVLSEGNNLFVQETIAETIDSEVEIKSDSPNISHTPQIRRRAPRHREAQRQLRRTRERESHHQS